MCLVFFQQSKIDIIFSHIFFPGWIHYGKLKNKEIQSRNKTILLPGRIKKTYIDFLDIKIPSGTTSNHKLKKKLYKMKNNITFKSKIKKYNSLFLQFSVIKYGNKLYNITTYKKNNSDKKESLESISLFVKKNKREQNRSCICWT